MSAKPDEWLQGYDARTLRLVSLEQFVQKPSVRWLVRDILQPNTLAVTFGPPKGGKTFTMTDLLMHGAHGLDWHGHRIPRPLRVAFLAGEGHNGLRLRLHAWLAHHDTAERCGDFQVLPQALALPERELDVVELLKPYQPDIVLVDTLSAYFGAGEQNVGEDMARFVRACRYVQHHASCCVAIIHHTGHGNTGRESGSNQLRRDVDTIIQVDKDENDSGLVGFQVVTGRDQAGWPQALSLRLRAVETDWLDDEGKPMTTCVVEAADAPVSLPGRSGRKLNDKQRITIECVQTLARARANGSRTVLLHRHEIVDEAVKRGVNRTVAYRHLHDLAERMHWKLFEPGTLEVRV